MSGLQAKVNPRPGEQAVSKAPGFCGKRSKTSKVRKNLRQLAGWG